MFAQYKARLQLVRQMNITSCHYALSWHVGGSFMRLLLAGGKSPAIFDSELVFLLAPNRGDIPIDRVFRSVSRIKGELEIAGIIDIDDMGKDWTDDDTYSSSSGADFDAVPIITKGITGVEPIHVDLRFKANMFLADAGIVSVPVLIKAFTNSNALTNATMHRLSTDNIMLGADNIFTMRLPYTDGYDRLNHTQGIALLDRIVQLQQTSTVQQLVPFTVQGGTMAIVGAGTPEMDACLLLDAAQLRKEGLVMVTNDTTINGKCTSVEIVDATDPVVAAASEPCPICFEKAQLFVPLRCHHTFCVQCLSKHMLHGATNPAGWSACPLCRAHISVV
jgi:hypothetical protein